MKKFYTLTLLFLGFAASVAQTIVYSENFGTPSGTTPIATHAFQNTAPITYSGTADVRGTQPSNTYTGASAAGNVFFTNTAGRFLLIEGINTSAYPTADLALTFGLRQEGTNPAVPASSLLVEASIDGTNFTPLSYNRTVNSTWEQITIGNSTIPSTANLRLRFTQTGTTQYRIDDVRIVAQSATCLLSLGAETKACAAITGEIDTFTITIPYTGGGTATYNIVSTHGVISGDNPTNTAGGNITISGINENISGNVTVTITGGTCNITREITPISCKPINGLPYGETFDYTPGTVLGDYQLWAEANTGDRAIILPGNLNYTGITPTGNSVGYGGAGAETYTPFTETTSGGIYVSFLMSVTDMSNVTTEGAQTYIAGLTGTSTSDYRARLWLQKTGTQYNIGFSSAATTTNYTTTAYNVGDVVLIIMGYDFATNTSRLWINPDVATFNAATTTPTLTDTPAAAPANFGAFILRQDSATNTPAAIVIDELRLATSADGVLSTEGIDGAVAEFRMFPNPLTGNILTITSAGGADRQVAIYDLLGKEVLKTATVNNTVIVDGLTTGIYMVKITEEGRTVTKKLVVQ